MEYGIRKVQLASMSLGILIALTLLGSLVTWVLLLPLEWWNSVQLPGWFGIAAVLLLLSWLLGD
jgi:hypothetical protein